MQTPPAAYQAWWYSYPSTMLCGMYKTVEESRRMIIQEETWHRVTTETGKVTPSGCRDQSTGYQGVINSLWGGQLSITCYDLYSKQPNWTPIKDYKRDFHRAFHDPHQKLESICWSYRVHPSSHGTNAMVRWSCSGSSWWPKVQTLYGGFVFPFQLPSICLCSVTLWLDVLIS